MAGRATRHSAGHGIIYTLTVRDANQVAEWLKTQGFNVEAYTGKLVIAASNWSKRCSTTRSKR